MEFEDFLTLRPDTDIDSRIAQQQQAVEAVSQAQHINNRSLLSEIAAPSLPDQFAALLGRTIDDIAQDAETRLAKHLAEHDMEADGSKWIAQGMEQGGRDTCPFCGQNIQGLPLIAAYRAVFDDRYKALRGDIVAMRNQISNLFGGDAVGQLNIQAEKNKSSIEFWNRFFTFDPGPLTLPRELPEKIRAFGDAALGLLKRKEQSPLEPIQPDTAFQKSKAIYETTKNKVKQIAAEIRAVNVRITAKKEETGSADVEAAQAELARLKATKIRHTDAVADLCEKYVRLMEKKALIERRKSKARMKLEEYTNGIMRPYEERINQYLEAFNADFQIIDTKHGFPAGTAASSYRLLINKAAIDLGDRRTSADRHSFKNTLSSGDRTTLALAFFLTHLEKEQNLATKIVVFDDPFSSQDAFRRGQTVHEIYKMGCKCAQVIVLSHDATFLKQIWDKVSARERTALVLADHRAQGTKIMALNLELACQGRTAKDIDDLRTYLDTGAGTPQDIVRKMRTVLEAYCWTTYSSWFQAKQDWLGEIVRKIREHGNQHPAQGLYDDLEQINDYTKPYHHGKDMTDITPDQIDPLELTGYVKRTIKIVNALQA